MRLAAWLLVATAIAGCQRGPSLRVTVSGIAPAAARLAATFTVGGMVKEHDFLPPSAIGEFACSESFTLELPAGTSGTLHVDVRAVDRTGGATLAEQATDVDLAAATPFVTLALAPSGCGPLDGGAPVDSGGEGGSDGGAGGLVFATRSAGLMADLFAVATNPSTGSVYAAGDGVAVVNFTGIGAWSTLFHLDASAISFAGIWGSGDTIIGVGYPAAIEETLDGDVSYSNIGGGTNSYDAIAKGPTGLFVVGDNGTVLVSRDGGKSFVTASQIQTPFSLRAVVPLTGIVLAVGDGGLVCRSTDDGKSFSTMQLPGSPSLAAAWGVSASDLWIAGDAAVYHSGDLGEAFAVTPTAPPLTHIRALWGSGSGALYVGGKEGIARSTDGGTSWQSFLTDLPVYAITGDAAGNVWAVGGAGLLLHHHE